MRTWILGIDPGCPGAVMLRAPVVGVHTVQEGPWRERVYASGRKRKQVHAPALHLLLRNFRALDPDARHVAFIEDVHSMPSDGNVQAFAFGRSVQAWEQAAEIEGWEILLVTPQVWQRRVPGISGSGKARKLSYHAAALARWPEHRDVLVGPRDGARLDPAAALWIADYGASLLH